MGFGVILKFIFWCAASWGSVLVLEYKAPDDDTHHGESVEHIACKSSVVDCGVFYTEFFLEDFQKEIESVLTETTVVNMSFGFQNPDFVIGGGPSRRGGGSAPFDDEETVRKKFNKQKDNLEEMFLNNQDVLFTIASGNGFFIGPIPTKGAPLGKRFAVYPAYSEGDNLLKVSAVDGLGVDFENLAQQSIEPYANYSLWNVDVAAVVEENHEGERLNGTSFAAPYVARLAGEMRNNYPKLRPVDVKEIIMKSSYVKNIERAIWASQDYKAKGEESVVFKVHNDRNVKRRNEFKEEIGDILLVKSGGVVVPEAAHLCAKIYQEAVGLLSIEDACLESQKHTLYANKYRTELLKKLWRLRGF
ncbi:MAG: S8 family serine peptidase [Bdellovibrionales bacterium]